MPVITGLSVHDLRFPTSRTLAGSDAMNRDPDYSAAYVVLRTDDPAAPEGHGLTFTLGRGNELCVAAVRALAPLVVGRPVEEFEAMPGAFWRRLVGDSQLRWVGPEKGVVHLATAAVVNALWDLRARRAGQPLWKLLADLPPEQLVACVDFRYLADALTPGEALDLLRRAAPGKAAREAALRRDGYPAYTTSAGWLGYPDDTVRALCAEAVAAGWTALKVKVGADPADDLRRVALVRETIGPDRILLLDANQAWEVPQAVDRMRDLARFRPLWIEEPTSPDDVLGHAAIAKAVAPIGVAAGEAVQNRVVFKQLLQTGAIQYCQLDACRLGGVSEAVAVVLLAAKFGVPVCPHAGGVGLCEINQHLPMFDFVAVSGSCEDRRVEYVDHLHEHFLAPVEVRGGRYRAPTAPGCGLAMRPESIEAYAYPEGRAWRSG